jgi:nucleoside-diphosphate-sugar epimerase
VQLRALAERPGSKLDIAQQLLATIIELTGSKSRIVEKPLPVDDPKVRQPDIARARRLLDWEPTLAVEEGLRQTIEWYRRPGPRPGFGKEPIR